jgi:DNA repair exonuclease SbcCD ATPase subunit
MARRRRRLRPSADSLGPSPQRGEQRRPDEDSAVGGAVSETGTAEVAPGETALAAEDLSLDLSAIGEEVGTVLKSAHAAAAKIRRMADEEAERVRAEARTAAAQELDEVHRSVEADRAEARLIRSEAEAHAEETRAQADAFSWNRMAEATREAEQVLEEAQRRLKAADADVEQKLRQAGALAQQRVDALNAEATRAEDWLENLLAVFQGMTSQLEELLGSRAEDDRDANAAPEQQQQQQQEEEEQEQEEEEEEEEEEEKALDDVLRPDGATARRE